VITETVSLIGVETVKAFAKRFFLFRLFNKPWQPDIQKELP